MHLSNSSIIEHCLNKQLPAVEREVFVFGDPAADQHTKSLVDVLLELMKAAQNDDHLLVVTSGFVIDLAAGKLVRSHHDLDLLVPESDLLWVRQLLEARGFAIDHYQKKNPKTAFFGTKGDLIVDIGGFNVSQTEVFDNTNLDGSKFIWPVTPEEFLWSRTIDGMVIPFVSPKAIYHFKSTSGRNDQKDVADLKMLEIYL